MQKQLFALGLVLTSLLATAETIEIKVFDSAGQPAQDAAVYVEPIDGKVPQRKATAIIDQIDKEFVPLLTVMQTGTLVRFPNKDNIRHHVYSFSPAKVFDLPLYSGTKADPVLFDRPGQVVLGCNIHDWMIAYALVVDSPWFGKTDKQGVAHIEELPAGEYELKAWHPYQLADAPVQRIKVGPGVDMHFKFQIKLAPPPPRPRPKGQY